MVLLPMLFLYFICVSVLFFAHTIADFVFQTDWMATNKSSNLQALGLHIITYSCVLSFFVLCLSFVIDIKFVGAILFILTNGLLHFITDFITSRITKYYWIRERRHEFFVTIGFDQLVHNLILFWTAWFLFIDKLQ